MRTAAARPGQDDARAETLVASYERAGYARVAPTVLQPAEPFLDLSGEDIRKRMFLTTDPQGRELCLRPDLTIPVSRDYLASRRAGRPQGYCYLGQVFRHRADEPSEFLQAGIESFGRLDIAAADAEMLALGLDATAHYGLNVPDIRIGDVGLFAALIAALDLAPAWKRRLIKDFNHKQSLAQDLERLTISPAHARPEYQGVLAALAGSDPKGARALVTDLISIAGITTVGGRTVGEIADRFLEQATLSAQTSLPRETRALIERFLAVAGDPDEAAAELHTIARDGKLKLDADANHDIDAMLAVSDNNAADEMWDWFARPATQMARWRDSYGMSSASYVDGFPSRWGFVKCSAQDLANLMSYILDKADPQLRSFFVDRMRTVGKPQQWGVWGAGANLRPGVKDGWSVEADDHGNGHWITATVGFVGPDERYVVGAMYDQPTGGDTIEAGVHTLTDLVATVFGAPVPAPAFIPEDY